LCDKAADDVIMAGGRTAPPFPKTEKAARGGLFFFFYSISSEYQVERINLPNFFG
jgi:hypothetical protein